MIITEAEIRRQVEKEFNEFVPQRRKTIFFCGWCKEQIRLGEVCVIEEEGMKQVHLHARCYGEWLKKEG